MIKLICLGKLKENYLKDGVIDYFNRINKYHKFQIVELKDSEDIFVEEKEILNELYKHNSFKILLDISANELSSTEFSKLIDNKLMTHGNIIFIIGGSNGVSDYIKSIVDYKVSFGKITIPHGLFRLVFSEQLYRAFKILNNEKYHK